MTEHNTAPNIGGFTVNERVRILKNAGKHDGRAATVMTLDHDHGWRLWVVVSDHPHPLRDPNGVSLYVDPDDIDHLPQGLGLAERLDELKQRFQRNVSTLEPANDEMVELSGHAYWTHVHGLGKLVDEAARLTGDAGNQEETTVVVGTGAGGEGDPAPTEATPGVTRSTDCPEAPAQAHHHGSTAHRYGWPDALPADDLEWSEAMHGANGPRDLRARLMYLTDLVQHGTTACPSQLDHYLGFPSGLPCAVCRDYQVLAEMMGRWAREELDRA